MKKYLLLFVAIVALGAGSYFAELRFLSYPNSPAGAPAPSAAEAPPQEAAAQAASTAALKVGETSHTIAVRPDETVMDAMRALQSSGALTFIGKDYPGMGFFVESMDGRKNADGYYWFLYINGKSADVGASDAIIRYGDTVEWRYEKSH